MKRIPLPVLPSIRFTSIEVLEGDTRDARTGYVLDGVLNMTAAVPDRSSPSREIEIRFGTGLPTHWREMGEANQVRWLRSKMMDLVGHEIDEMLFIAELGPDPHERERERLPPMSLKLKTFTLKDLVVDRPEDEVARAWGDAVPEPKS